MATLTIRNLDQALMARLRARAMQHGRSIEEEARCILLAVLKDEAEPETGATLVKAIRTRVAPSGDTETE